MEALRRSPAYAEGQIRLLLSDLKSSNHNVRVKAVKHFQDYIINYGPEIYDDDVDFLFTGINEAVKTGMGLLYFCGLDSEKHDGQLKRISAPVIALVNWLISLESEEDEINVFYERFVQLPVSELVKVNFSKHISIGGGGSKSKSALKAQKAMVLAGQTRSGSSADALLLLSVLMRDHRNAEGESEPIDLHELLENDKASHQIVDTWLSKSANEDVAKALQHFRGLKAQALAREIRPTTWSGVVFRPVPLQEGEEGEDEDRASLTDELPPYPDPLGVIEDIDLRATQALYTAGRLTVDNNSNGRQQQRQRHHRRNSSSSREGKEGGSSRSKKRTRGRSSSTVARSTSRGGGGDQDDESNADNHSIDGDDNGDREDDEDEDEDDDDLEDPEDEEALAEWEEVEEIDPLTGVSTVHQRRLLPSLLPLDKTFSPSLFLKMIHGAISFEDLRGGLAHLREQLKKQSNERENLVRSHFGLFVHCAEGLQWLKAYRNGTLRDCHFDIIRGEDAGTGGGHNSGSYRNLVTNISGRSSYNSRWHTSSSSSSSKGGAGADGGGKGKGGYGSGGMISGEDALMQALTGVLTAQRGARNILAPILQRMSLSRKIRYAEQSMRALAGTLEHPNRMKVAYDRGDFEEVLLIYSKVRALVSSGQTIATTTTTNHAAAGSAEFMVTHVKEKADEIIALLRSHAHRVLWGQGQGQGDPTFTHTAALTETASSLITPSGSPSKTASSGVAASPPLRDAANPSSYPDSRPSLSATPFAVLHRHAVILSELDCPYQHSTPSTHVSSSGVAGYGIGQDARQWQAVEEQRQIAYREHLQKAFARHLMLFGRAVQQTRATFVAHALEATMYAQSLHQAAKAAVMRQSLRPPNDQGLGPGADLPSSRRNPPLQISVLHGIHSPVRGTLPVTHPSLSSSTSLPADGQGLGQRLGPTVMEWLPAGITDREKAFLRACERGGKNKQGSGRPLFLKRRPRDKSPGYAGESHGGSNGNVMRLRGCIWAAADETRARIVPHSSSSDNPPMPTPLNDSTVIRAMSSSWRDFGLWDEEEGEGDYDSDDGSEDEGEGILFPSSHHTTSSSSSLTAGGPFSTPTMVVDRNDDEEEDEGGLRPFASVLSARVRVLYALRLMQTIDAWLPVLYRLLEAISASRTPDPRLPSPASVSFGESGVSTGTGTSPNLTAREKLLLRSNKSRTGALNSRTSEKTPSFTSFTHHHHASYLHAQMVNTACVRALDQALAQCAAAVRGCVAEHSLSTLSVGDHIYGDVQTGGSVVNGAGGFSSTSFPSFESAGGGGADQRSGDVVGQLPHLLTLFSPSPAETQGIVDRASIGVTAGTKKGTIMGIGKATKAADSEDHDPLNHPNDGYAPHATYDPALALSRPWFTDPLHEPHLPWVVAEIATLYRDINALVGCDDGGSGVSNSKNNDSNNNNRPSSTQMTTSTAKQNSLSARGVPVPAPAALSTPFPEAVGILRALSREGEAAAARGVMGRLGDWCGSFWSTHEFKSTREGLEHVTRQFESACLRGLFRVHCSSSHPAWVARAVIEGVSLSISSFVEALRYEALAPAIAALMGDVPPGTMDTGAGSGGAGGRVERTLLPDASSGSLASLEASLKTCLALIPGPSTRPQSNVSNIPTMSAAGRGIYHSSVVSDGARALSMTSDTASGILIDLLRAMITLRTQTLAKVWQVALRHFPLDTSSAGAAAGVGGNVGISIRHSSSLPHPSSSSPGMDTGTKACRGLYPRLQQLVTLAFAALADTAARQVVLISALEGVKVEAAAARAYVTHRSHALRAAIHAGYTVMAQRERQGLGLTQGPGLAPNASNNSTPSGSCLPSHLARVLVLLGQERNYLNQVLQGVTVEHGQGSVQRQRQAHGKGEGSAAATEENTHALSDKSQGAGSGSSAAFSRGERYSDFLYGELCMALLGMYLELKESLGKNTFPHGPETGLGPAPSKLRSSALLYPCTLVQAMEEMEYMKAVLRSINILATGSNNNNNSGNSNGGDNSGGVDGMNLNPLSRNEIEQYYHLLTKASIAPPQHNQQHHHSQSLNKLAIVTASELMGLKEGETLVALMRQSD